MRTIKQHIILILFVITSSCNAQKRFVENDDFCEFDDRIHFEEKKLFITAKEDSILSHQGYFIRVDNDSTKVRLSKHPNNGTTTLNKINKILGIQKSIVYKDLNIIGSFFKYIEGNLNIGKKIEYDLNGNSIKTIDHRQSDNYPICFKEAIHIVENRIAKKDTVFSINREKEIIKNKDTLYYWEVFVDEINDKPARTAWIYRVDGKTGKILKKISAVTGLH